MKIRIFFSQSEKTVEEDVNEFIKDKKVIDIKFSTDQFEYFNILVTYEESQ